MTIIEIAPRHRRRRAMDWQHYNCAGVKHARKRRSSASSAGVATWVAASASWAHSGAKVCVQRREKRAGGNRYRVQRPVQLRQWWTVGDGGVAHFGVRYRAVSANNWKPLLIFASI